MALTELGHCSRPARLRPLGVIVLMVAGELLRTAPAAAQVNVEPLRKQLDAEEGFALRLAASFAGYVGNTNGLTAGGAGLFGARGGRHLTYVNASGDYAEYDSETTVAKYFGHGRYNYDLAARVAWEVFAQIESDRFRRVRLRELVGTGPRFGLVRTRTFDLFYGSAWMPEWTQWSEEVAVEDRFAHRWSNYASFAWSPDERVTITHATYYQPRFDDFEDFKILSVSSLGFAITPLLESKVDVTVRYESWTPPEVNEVDAEVKNSIGLAF